MNDNDNEKVKIEVFTSPTCPHCPHAKKAVMKYAEGKTGIKVVETSTFTNEGQKRAREFEVRTVPTVFVTSQSNPDRIAFAGVPGEKQLERMINISLGKDEMPKHESFLEKIKGIFA